MKANTFGRFLHVFINMFFGGLGYKVIFGNYTPSMSHKDKKVYLPRLPVGEVTEDVYKLFVGWAVHESCHRFTDWTDMVNHIHQYNSKKLASLLQGLVNAIEDPRCEAVHLKTYPGSHSQLRGRLAVSVEQGRVRDGTNGPADALQMYCCHWGRAEMLGHIEVAGQLETARAELVKHLGEEGFARIEALVTTVMPGLESVWDAYDLSLCILDELADMAEGNDSDNSSEEGDNQQDGESGDNSKSDTGESSGEPGDDDGESNSSSNSDTDDEDASDDDAPSSDTGSAGDESDESDVSDGEGGDSASDDEGNSESDTGDNSQPSGNAGAQAILNDEGDDVDLESEELVQALVQAIKQEIKKQMAELGTNNPDEVVNHEDVGDKPAEAAEDIDAFRTVKSETGMATASMKQRLVSLLAAQNRSYKVSSRKGRLSSRHITRAAVGNPYVYERKVYEEKPVSALTILVDMSDSMNWTNANKLAQQSLIAIAEACNAIGAPLEILGFGQRNGTSAGLVEIKPFGKTYQQCQSRLGGYAGMLHGNTPMGEGMLEAGDRLLKHSAPRKVMMVLTDGDPNMGSPVVPTIELLKRQGVELIGIGMQSDAVKEYFPVYSVVNQLEDLGQEVMSVVTNALMAA
jgi:hypothetical protein